MNKGVLYIVATPIGNLSDLTMRACEILKQVDCIVAEDTRHSAKLLKYYGISTPMTSMYEHNENRVSAKILNRLEQGQSIAVISDGGTPLINDPGYPLVQSALHQDIKIVPIPGANSIITALSVCGLAINRFSFEGFLPAKKVSRRQLLQSLAIEERTLVFFEAPHRIKSCLADCVEIFGPNRQAVVARELTKLHESLHRGTLEEILGLFQDSVRCKGEMVVVVSGAEPQQVTMEEGKAREIAQLLNTELPVKKAASMASTISGYSKNDIYQWLIKTQNNDD